MIFVVALAAAAFLGLGFMVQQHAAYREPLWEMLRIRLLLDLVRSPLWLAGVAAMLCGQILGGLALNEANVAKVEPLLATNLIFALFIGHIVYKEHLAWKEWLGAVLATGGVALFLALGQPHGDRPAGPVSFHWLAACAAVAAALLLVWGGRRFVLKTRAMLLASAAGMLFGVQDVLTRGVLLTLGIGAHAVLVTWQPYVLPVIAVLGLLLAESAFDAAPLRVSLPAMTAAEPLTGIALGVAIFAERLRLSSGALAGEVIGLCVMVAGIVILGRSPFLGKRTDSGLERGP